VVVTTHLIPEDIRDAYKVHEWRNGAGVISIAHPKEWRDIIDVLRTFEFKRSGILKGSGRKSVIRAADRFVSKSDWATYIKTTAAIAAE
jgi:hypothetical protein